MQDLSNSQTRSPNRYRVKSVGPGTRMVLRPGMGLTVSVQARENPTGPLIGLGAGAVDLKFVYIPRLSLNIGASVFLPYLGMPSQI